MFKKGEKNTLPSLYYSGNAAQSFFLRAVSLSAIIYILVSAIVKGTDFYSVFFVEGGDFFMDFFNSIRDAAQGSAVYTERHVIYPPLANLLYLVLSLFTPAEYNNTTFEERYSWARYTPNIVLMLVWCLICFLIFMFVVTKVQKKGYIYQKLTVSALLWFSLPMLYLLERGNIIILALFALVVYAFTYNSDSKIKRELGLIALAFAFAIKLYPVVFGWFLIADKRFKEALRCVAYGLIMLIVPSFFFGGFSCFYQIYLNIFSFSSGSDSTLGVILNYIGTPSTVQTVVTILVYAWVFICGICFALSPFIRKDAPYKTWVMGLVTILCFPSLTSIYSWAFMLIPMVMLFNTDKLTKKQKVYSVMMAIPFVFIPFRFGIHVSANIVLVYIMTAVLSIWCVTDTIIDTVRYFKERKV